MKKYYIDAEDYVYCVDSDGKVYEYHYVKKSFQLCSLQVDCLYWHEFDEKDLDEMIKLKAWMFK